MSKLIRWDPFERSLTLREAMRELFEDRFNWEGSFARSEIRPLALDVRETEEALIVEGSLPGMKPEDVDVSISGSVLTIKGESKEEKEEEKGSYLYRERRFGAFQRTITLPAEVDVEGAEAAFKDGVLTLTLPKAEESQAKRIEVKS